LATSSVFAKRVKSEDGRKVLKKCYFAAKARKRNLGEDRRIAKHLLAEFGDSTRLRDLTASRIAAYRERHLAAGSVRRKDEAGKARRLSAASVNRPLALLRHLLRLAHEEWEVLRAGSPRGASGGSSPMRSRGCWRRAERRPFCGWPTS
jgi:hypothetical protein